MANKLYSESKYSTIPDGLSILNVIRENATQSYKERIPVATENNLSVIGENLFTYQSSMNEFLTAVVNRIGRVLVSNKMYNNPLKDLKEGVLSFGETTEEIFVNLIKAHSYDPNRSQYTLFKRHIPDVRAVFHTMNDQREYPFTISNAQLRTAFLSYEGVEKLVGKIVNSAYASDNYDEYLITKRMIAKAGANGHFATVAIGDISVDSESAKKGVIALRSLSTRLTFMSELYNLAGVSNYTPYEDQIVLITPENEATISVDVLAYAFNMDKANYLSRRIIVDDFGGLDDVIALVVDRNWFKIYDDYMSFTDVFNAEGLNWNYFLHHWETFSYSPFSNAVALLKTEGIINSVTVVPTTVNLSTGSEHTFEAQFVSSGTVSKAVNWSVEGNTSQNTVIDYLGNLHIAEDEESKELTVTAVSRQDNTKSGTSTVTVE